MLKQSLKAIGRLLCGGCPEQHEILRYAQNDRASAQNDTKGRARNDKRGKRLLRGACPECHEILRYAQNDTKGKARNDSSSW